MAYDHKRFFWYPFSEQFTFIINMIMAMTKENIFLCRTMTKHSNDVRGGGEKRDSEGKPFAMMLVEIKGRKRKLPEITCKHIFS